MKVYEAVVETTARIYMYVEAESPEQATELAITLKGHFYTDSIGLDEPGKLLEIKAKGVPEF